MLCPNWGLHTCRFERGFSSAVLRLQQAVEDYWVDGVQTNRQLILNILGAATADTILDHSSRISQLSPPHTHTPCDVLYSAHSNHLWQPPIATTEPPPHTPCDVLYSALATTSGNRP